MHTASDRPSPALPPLPPEDALGPTVISKVTWRLMPLLFLCYIIAYIDRINVGFAKLQLQEALGIDPLMLGRVFGIGAGLFFFGYFLFELPSNLILHRVGARLWIARIMILWGLVSVGMMFMKSVTVFYVMRFTLGVAEAGFFPGVILYLTYWFPAQERAKTIAMFATGGVVAGVVGSPLSGAILDLNGFLDIAGWQWLFLLEGLPAVVMGIVVLVVLPNRPENAVWLNPREREWLQAKLAAEAAQAELQQRHRLVDALSSGRVWLLALLYLLLNIGGYGYEMWMPTLVKEGFHRSHFMTGVINAGPYLIAAVVMLIVGRMSDRTGERRLPVAIGAMVSAFGFAVAGKTGNPFIGLAGLTLALVGLKATLGPFWTLGTAFLSGTAAAGGIALINSVGNLGGFAGPFIVGYIKDHTGSSRVALFVLGGALLTMGLLALTIRTGSAKKPVWRRPA